MSPSDDLHDPLHPPGGGFSLVEFATRRRVTVAMMTPVSYTHLDVYKRQIQARVLASAAFAELVDFALC